MKKIFSVVFGLFVLGIYVAATVNVWKLCLPLAIVMICFAVYDTLKDIIRKVFAEAETPKQNAAMCIAYLPVDAYVVYTLWQANQALAITYGILTVIGLFKLFFLTQNGEN